MINFLRRNIKYARMVEKATSVVAKAVVMTITAFSIMLVAFR